MKKLFKWFAMCLVVIPALFTFAACTDPDKGGDGGNDGGSGGGSETTTSYTITYTNGTGYTLSGVTTAKAGDKVTVTVNVTEYDVRVTSVKYNNSTCSKADDGKYSFTMPSQNVTVSATSEKITAIEEDRPVSWQQEGALQIAKTEGVAEIKYDVSDTFCTSADVSVISTNQAAIPNSALSQNDTKSNTSNSIIGGVVTIDLTKVSVGKTFIVLDFQNGNSTSSKGTIIKEVEIVSEGTEIDENIVTLNIELSLISIDNIPSDMYIRFVDSDYVSGSSIDQERVISITRDPQNETLDFVVGHKYYIYCSAPSVLGGASYEIYEIKNNDIVNLEYQRVGSADIPVMVVSAEGDITIIISLPN